jgi:hypothetical protein
VPLVSVKKLEFFLISLIFRRKKDLTGEEKKEAILERVIDLSCFGWAFF